MSVVIDMNGQLALDDVVSVARGGRVSVDPATLHTMAERRRQIETRIKREGLPAYGFNRGFGHNVDLAVSCDRLTDLQRNLILSHSVGAGPRADAEVVRATMLLRANSLARGFSGVRPVLVERLVACLNAGVTPAVPELGSVGASGDLAPLSHIAMTLMGEGRADFDGREMDSAEALRLAGIEPLVPGMKEGLALTNGVQFMNALGMLACHDLKTLLRTASVNTALAAQVMLAPDTYFRPDFHAVRPHPGAVRVADWVWRLMQGSPLRQAHKDFKVDGQVQDPYNLRCAAQVLGSCHELIDQAERSLTIEANSATDNPILLPDGDGEYVDVVSGGHFHGMPVAVPVYNLFQALGIMASLAHQRSVRFVDPNRNKGLGRDLKWPDLPMDERSVSSGMMMLEYASAALVNDLWGKAMPSHLFNISTNSGQEDHVSMGTSLAVRLRHALPGAARVLGIELAYVAQAAAIRKRLHTIPTEAELPPEVLEKLAEVKTGMNGKGRGVVFDVGIVREHPLKEEERRLSPVSEKVLDELSDKKLFTTVERDRCLSPDVERLAGHVLSGGVVRTVVEEVPLNW